MFMFPALLNLKRILDPLSKVFPVYASFLIFKHK